MFAKVLIEKLRYKDAHCRLRKAFPFDIINLDVCGVMFPPRKTSHNTTSEINYSNFRVANGIMVFQSTIANVTNSHYFLPLTLTQI